MKKVKSCLENFEQHKSQAHLITQLWTQYTHEVI
jgi:hypothetical protein